MAAKLSDKERILRLERGLIYLAAFATVNLSGTQLCKDYKAAFTVFLKDIQALAVELDT